MKNGWFEPASREDIGGPLCTGTVCFGGSAVFVVAGGCCGGWWLLWWLLRYVMYRQFDDKMAKMCVRYK